MLFIERVYEVYYLFQQARISAVVLLGMTLLTGLVYPLSITIKSQFLFPKQSRGSLLEKDGVVVGSEWIGQSFVKPEFFWGRLSATVPHPYNAAASSGSNLGPSNPLLLQLAKQRAQALRLYPTPSTPIPVDLITSSGSGLDPHISPEAAAFQIPRVAQLRGMSVEKVRELVHAATEGRQFGILGEPRVHVLKLNLALDAYEAP